MYSQYVLLKTNSYIIRMNREDNLCWFHGKVSRDKAEQILREEGMGDGVFLVRDSNSSGGDYVLSVLHKGEVWHYQIRRHGEDAFFSIDDQTPIHGLDSLIEHYQGATHGLVTQLSAIVKRDPPPHDSRSHGRTNLLHRATKEGDFTVVSELLKCGYRNIDAKNQDGQTAVHLACRFGNERMIRKLIESGANVNCRDTEGNTPLHYASRHQPASVIRMLHEAKANIQARNNSTGCVPLHDAARQGNLEVVKELIQLGAPPLPRSSYGELPTDYAKEGNHKEVMKFFEEYNYPPASVYKFQWYHGTLDRTESNQILKQFAKSLIENHKNDVNTTVEEEKETTEYSGSSSSGDKGQAFNLTSGIFLVRYSEKNGDYVLTLLFEDQPKHFIIQKFHKHLYIDEGPYMPSLEHLVEHYMRTSDGLPINLKYPVPPKPKPPLPLFSTIPKKNRMKNSPSFEHASIEATKSTTAIDDATTNNRLMKTLPHRNMSIPSDDLMHTVGLTADTPTSHDSKRKSKDRNNDILNFRSLKLRSPKRNIIDGMKSLKKTKTKSANSKKDATAKSPPTDELIAQSLKNLSFSSDFTTAAAADTLYNVPPNNSPIVDTSTIIQNRDDIQNQNVTTGSEIQNAQPSDDYFTQSDCLQNKGMEEIYFVDAPTIAKATTEAPSTSFQYVAFKQVPYFPEPGQVSDNNNITLRPELRLDRLDSTLSAVSRDSDLSFHHQHQHHHQPGRTSYGDCSSPGIAAKPNYFIPKSHLLLNDVLGEGEFGSVYRGVFKCFNGPDEPAVTEIPVAIKTLHDEHCKQNRTEFLREASVMIKLSHHCIVRLIGISKGPPLMMVQELVTLGSMLNYLITNADQINANFELKIWASQIACGMNFLESHHFVHRDLAARNILLASKHQAKISDFGLSRALCTGNDYYQASQGGKWPIKWYAPESFNYGTFSHASDVWSFGVTLWEMFSYGEAPYGDLKGVDVIKLVEIGKRLSKPKLCPDNVFQIMENCWNYNPKDRPTFRHLTQFFANDPDYQNLVELINTEHIS